MATGTDIYTAEAKLSAMKSDVTSAADTTVLGAGNDVQVIVAKTATNKAAILNTLDAVRQKLVEEIAT